MYHIWSCLLKLSCPVFHQITWWCVPGHVITLPYHRQWDLPLQQTQTLILNKGPQPPTYLSTATAICTHCCKLKDKKSDVSSVLQEEGRLKYYIFSITKLCNPLLNVGSSVHRLNLKLLPTAPSHKNNKQRHGKKNVKKEMPPLFYKKGVTSSLYF